MKSYVGYACLCAILMLLASPAVLAGTYTVEDGGNDGYGGGGGVRGGSRLKYSLLLRIVNI